MLGFKPPKPNGEISPKKVERHSKAHEPSQCIVGHRRTSFVVELQNPPRTQPSPFTTGALAREPSSLTSIRTPPPISKMAIDTVPPGRRELVCRTALVTTSEASKTATSVAGSSSPRVLITNDRASLTCSGCPGIVRLPITAALAIMARSSADSLALAATADI